MTPLVFLFVIFSESCSASGQIFFKKAMGSAPETMSRAKFTMTITMGVIVMTLGVLTWQGLMSKFPLSYLYPFDSLNRILLVIGASIFLKEKMTVGLWVGVLLICAGVLLVSAS